MRSILNEEHIERGAYKKRSILNEELCASFTNLTLPKECDMYSRISGYSHPQHLLLPVMCSYTTSLTSVLKKHAQ
jgi:hypothetical protein